MKRVLFIDRDGTLVVEPPVDYQLDSFGKLEFVPKAIGSMSRIATLGFELVMATNQDGLGTESFPEETFWPVQNLIIKTLEGEGIHFDDVLIDRTLPEQNAPTRKPGTGMFGRYLAGGYDLKGSYVIGDRLTDVELARNLGARAILLRETEQGRRMAEQSGLSDVCALITDDWDRIWQFLRAGERTAVVERRTRETDIRVRLDLDGSSTSRIDTGLKFFDHMLDQIVHHAGISLDLQVRGDLQVDEHHTIEDTAIALGEAIRRALGSKLGIGRYGFCLPMDECRAAVLLDFGGRIELVWNARFSREYVGDVPTEMFRHFFKSLAESARCNLYVEAKGENEHHKIEAIFKAFARAAHRHRARQLSFRAAEQQRNAMITIIDYDTGNLRSVANALGRLGAEYRITADPAAIRAAERVLLPGVGEASSAMAKLRERGLPDVIRSLKCPVLGICIGVQLLCRRSEEGNTECLGIFDNEVRRLRTEGLKVPHMGWDSIEDLRGPLFDGLDEGAYVYYVHSYAPQTNADTIARTTYGETFSAAIRRDNFFGTQFHPEKSASVGERILQNFLRL